jgi:hypothetical protein
MILALNLHAELYYIHEFGKECAKTSEIKDKILLIRK